ncbi:MAG: TetR/AcrR family transcriptional regulator [Syntrophaceae bacterium]|jgi:AcrR family transcriptional regulator|nr:TetR/AcrR family transcriptional regulator [Syntrophaceae bacterium]
MDKRGEIMQAALELIAEQGFHDAPMSEIAKKAGVAAGTIYRYFENKEVLINELFQEIEDKISKAILDGYVIEKPVREKFFFIFIGSFRYFLANPLHFRYMEQYINSPYGISKRRDVFLEKKTNHHGHETLRVIFEEGISQQILKNIPVLVLFSLFIGPMLYLIRDHILGFIVLDEPLIQQIAEACWDSIKR